MELRKVVRPLAVCALMIFPAALIAGGKYDGNWTTSMACEAHSETPAYKWQFPAPLRTTSTTHSTANKAAPATW
jgi:hypothetical protein